MADPVTLDRPLARDLRMTRLGRRLVPYALRRWPGMLAVLAALVLEVGVGLLKPWPLKVLIDNVLSGEPLSGAADAVFQALPGSSSVDQLLAWTIVATVVIFFLGWLVQLWRGVAGVRFGSRMTYDLAADVLSQLQRLSVRSLGRRGTGDLMRRVTTDSHCASTIVQDAALPVTTSMVSLVAMAVVMFRLDPLLATVSLVVLPLLAIGLRRYTAPMAMRGWEQQEAEARIYEDVERAVSGIATVQAYGAEPRLDRRFEQTTSTALDRLLRATAVQLRFKVWVGASTTVGTAAVLWLGAEHVLHGNLTLGEVLVFAAYLAAMYQPLQTVMYTSSTVQDAAGSLYRVLEVLDAEPDVRDGPRSLPDVRGGVRLDNVVFGYEADRPVLRGVSLHADPGETVALVGETGAGKSTIAGLLMRYFDPDGGVVSVDGVDLREVKVAGLRSQVSLVSQDSFLFPISIADNIAYGRPGATRREVWRAAQMANADRFITDLPEALDTVVGERGATLSGGQRQRIAIARALLKDAPILVLDEPTSALDAETELGLLGALERLMEGRTTFIIAHRLATVRNADRVYVLADGCVVESGSPAELVARGGRFADMWHASLGSDATAAVGLGA